MSVWGPVEALKIGACPEKWGGPWTMPQGVSNLPYVLVSARAPLNQSGTTISYHKEAKSTWEKPYFSCFPRIPIRQATSLSAWKITWDTTACRSFLAGNLALRSPEEK